MEPDRLPARALHCHADGIRSREMDDRIKEDIKHTETSNERQTSYYDK